MAISLYRLCSAYTQCDVLQFCPRAFAARTNHIKCAFLAAAALACAPSTRHSTLSDDCRTGMPQCHSEHRWIRPCHQQCCPSTQPSTRCTMHFATHSPAIHRTRPTYTTLLHVFSVCLPRCIVGIGFYCLRVSTGLGYSMLPPNQNLTPQQPFFFVFRPRQRQHRHLFFRPSTWTTTSPPSFPFTSLYPSSLLLYTGERENFERLRTLN